MYFNISLFAKNSIHARFIVAVGLNAIFAAIQFVYANQSHSVSLLSDALHNLGDVLGLLLAWIAQVLTNVQAQRRYTYGYKKLTILATFSNALLLILSAGIIGREAFVKLLNPHPMNETNVFLIASMGILVNSGAAFLFHKAQEKDINIKVAFLHLILDALISLSVVMGALLVYYTGYQWIDAIIAIIIAITILVGSWQLLVHSSELLLGAVPRHIDQEKVRQYLMQLPDIEMIDNLHIWAISTKEVVLTAHLLTSKGVLSDEGYTAIQKDLTEKFGIQEVTLQLLQKLS